MQGRPLGHWRANYARLLVAALTLGGVAASPPPRSGSATDSFARGLVELARREQDRDAAAFARLTGVALRNPNKWNDQSEEGRMAVWRAPANRVGVTKVEFSEFAGRLSADLELSGTPCVHIAQIERAAGETASRGGVGFTFVFDAPSPPPVELGDEHASLAVAGRGERVTAIVMLANDPGPRGCLQWLSLQSGREPPQDR